LLHIADDIQTLGPMSVTWTFYLERYCGFLKRELQSRSQPWKNIDIRLQHFARLSQLRIVYDLKDVLPSTHRLDIPISSREFMYYDCECLALHVNPRC
ncbi:hypothetical protein BC835DRAFT_1290373, partial [Cytidiella melzeri]